MQRFWLSWEQAGHDPRPVSYPPPAAVLAWWETGFNETHSMVVAIVEAITPEGAKAIVEATWNPGVDAWRFCDPYANAGPPGDRFPAPQPGDWNFDRWPWKAVSP